MSNMVESTYETPPFAVANRYISGSVRRGTFIMFDNGRSVANTADELTAADIDLLRLAGHTIVEDPGEQLPGIVSEAELQRRYDTLCAIVTNATAGGDLRTAAMNDEAMRMAGSALAASVARREVRLP